MGAGEDPSGRRWASSGGQKGTWVQNQWDSGTQGLVLPLGEDLATFAELNATTQSVPSITSSAEGRRRQIAKWPLSLGAERGGGAVLLWPREPDQQAIAA